MEVKSLKGSLKIIAVAFAVAVVLFAGIICIDTYKQIDEGNLDVTTIEQVVDEKLETVDNLGRVEQKK